MNQNLKTTIYDFISNSLIERVETYTKILNSITESKNNETKSSAGDKFETGRAMMQAEQDKVENQLGQAFQFQNVMQLIDSSEMHDKVRLGSLVVCNTGYYFISIGLGSVQVDGKKIYAISANSPIGQLLLEKANGDSIHWNSKEIIIKSVC